MTQSTLLSYFRPQPKTSLLLVSDDILACIFSYLHPIQLCLISRLHSRFNRIIKSLSIWEALCNSIVFYSEETFDESFDRAFPLKTPEDWMKAFSYLCVEDHLCWVCMEGRYRYDNDDRDEIYLHTLHGISTWKFCSKCHMECQARHLQFISEHYDLELWYKYCSYKGLTSHCFYHIDDEMCEEMDDAEERKEKITECLSSLGLELRDDSRLCWSYILEDQGHPEEIAETMAEMAWFFSHTQYNTMRLVPQNLDISDREFFPSHRVDSKVGKTKAIESWVTSELIKQGGVLSLSECSERPDCPPESLWSEVEAVAARLESKKRKRNETYKYT